VTTGTLLDRGRSGDPRELARRADWIRRRTIDLIDIAGTGHYASTFSCAELIAVLYYDQLRLREGDPTWPDRDRFLLGKGHVAVGLYPCLADLGFFPAEWLDGYTRLGNPLGDHPDMKTVPGIDFSSGSIGHNLSVGVGMSLSARLRGQDFRTVVLLGDGELHEGQVWEAAMSAAHFGLGNLVAVVDANGISLDGPVEDVMSVEPMADKWRAFGWTVHELDGNDTAALLRTFADLPETGAGTPTVLIARTRKGAGVSFMEDDPGWHLGYLSTEDRERALGEIDARLSADASPVGSTR